MRLQCGIYHFNLLVDGRSSYPMGNQLRLGHRPDNVGQAHLLVINRKTLLHGLFLKKHPLRYLKIHMRLIFSFPCPSYIFPFSIIQACASVIKKRLSVEHSSKNRSFICGVIVHFIVRHFKRLASWLFFPFNIHFLTLPSCPCISAYNF